MVTKTVETITKMENDARVILNHEGKKVKAALEKFVGQKILNNGEVLAKKVKDSVVFDEHKVEPLTEGGFAKVHYMYFSSSAYSMYLHLSLCYNGGNYDDNNHYCLYHEQDLYVGDIKKQILAKLFCEEKPMLDVKKELENFDKAVNLKKELEDVLDLLFYANRELAR